MLNEEYLFQRNADTAQVIGTHFVVSMFVSHVCQDRGESESGAGLPGWNSGTCSYSGTQGWPTHQWPWCKEKLHHRPGTSDITLTHGTSPISPLSPRCRRLTWAWLFTAFGGVGLPGESIKSLSRQLTITMGIEYKVDYCYLPRQTLFL